MDHDPNHFIGPFRRSDIVAIVCFGLAIYLGVHEKKWESVAFGLLIAGGVLAGLSPRFQGHFGLKVADWFQLGATFAKPAQPPRLQAKAPPRQIAPKEAKRAALDAAEKPQA